MDNCEAGTSVLDALLWQICPDDIIAENLSSQLSEACHA